MTEILEKPSPFDNACIEGPPQQLAGFLVSPALFEIIGEPALRGRTLRMSDASAPERVAVISEEFWQRQFGGREDVLGTRLRLAGDSYAVVGVVPGRFRVPFGADVWAPLRFTPEIGEERGRGYLMVVGRLAAGVEPPQAEARLQARHRGPAQRLASHRQRGSPARTRGASVGTAGPDAGPAAADRLE